MSTISKSILGKLLGLDKDGYLTNPTGEKIPAIFIGPSGSEVKVDILNMTTVTAVTTAVTAAVTSGTGFTARGTVTLSSAAGTYYLGQPFTGVEVNIFAITTSTNSRTVAVSTGNGATIQSTAGSTFTTMTFAGGGEQVVLVGLSTALYGVLTNTTSTALS